METRSSSASLLFNSGAVSVWHRWISVLNNTPEKREAAGNSYCLWCSARPFLSVCVSWGGGLQLARGDGCEHAEMGLAGVGGVILQSSVFHKCIVIVFSFHFAGVLGSVVRLVSRCVRSWLSTPPFLLLHDRYIFLKGCPSHAPWFAIRLCQQWSYCNTSEEKLRLVIASLKKSAWSAPVGFCDVSGNEVLWSGLGKTCVSWVSISLTVASCSKCRMEVDMAYWRKQKRL